MRAVFVVHRKILLEQPFCCEIGLLWQKVWISLLCVICSVCRTERQWADLAVSLSLLSVCERGFKKLQECWDCYSDKLTEPGVYQPLLSIAAKLRRRAKQQFKVLHLWMCGGKTLYYTCTYARRPLIGTWWPVAICSSMLKVAVFI